MPSRTSSLESPPAPREASFPPVWAGGWGEDRGRRFAHLVVGGAVMEMLWIEPDTFWMGSPTTEKGRFADEIHHQVTLTRGFWIGRFPVTQEQWTAVMGKNPSARPSPAHPVEKVSWDDAMGFAERINGMLREVGVASAGFGFRLPTEAEWEYACRAGTTTAFNDGSDLSSEIGQDPALDRLGWYYANSGRQTHAVGGREPNAWGLYDCHGNILEWCLDRVDFDGQVRSNTYVDGVTDPLGAKGARRVVRGGSAWYFARLCRSAYRDANDPGYRDVDVGFRLAAGSVTSPGAERRSAEGADAPVPEASAEAR